MLKLLLKFLLKLLQDNELTISAKGISARGGMAVVLAFLFATMVYLALVF